MRPSIHRLRLAKVKLPGRFNPPSYRDSRIDVYAYLVIARTHVLLVDTGVGTGNGHIDTTFEPEHTPLTAELARHGLEPADVNLVVNSHLHFDHCGNNALLSNAEIFVQERELAIARSLGHRYTVTEWFDYAGARIHPIHGDSEIAPGVTLLATPGHTPGHESVLVEAGDAPVLIAAQAAFTADEYQRGGDPREQAHEGYGEEYVASISRLKSIRACEVHFSHDDRVATADTI